MARFIAAVLAVVGYLAAVAHGLADRRVALVIGNTAYQNVPMLGNTANDAEAMSILFKNLGFEVVRTYHNLEVRELRRAISDFSDATSNADIAVVYYAGHGIEVDGSNYLIPVDARLRRDVDIDDDAVSLERILKIVEPAKRLRLVILDACRDNPFAKNMKRTIAKRAIGRGLASIEPVTSDTMIAFAAKAGSTAEEGQGPNSPFTAALLKHLITPNLDVRLALGQVRDDVVRATSNRQEPFVYGSLGGSVVSLASPPDSERVIPIDPNAIAARDYENAEKLNTQASWQSFLKDHQTGFYADLARSRLAKLNAKLPPNDRAPKKEKPAAIKELKRQASPDAGKCVERCYAVTREKCAASGQCAPLEQYYRSCRNAARMGTTFCNL